MTSVIVTSQLYVPRTLIRREKYALTT